MNTILFMAKNWKSSGLRKDEEFIEDDGSSMIAYARIQFDDVTQEERDAVFNGLISYCELDTLAMEMIVEAWKEAFG